MVTGSKQDSDHADISNHIPCHHPVTSKQLSIAIWFISDFAKQKFPKWSQQFLTEQNTKKNQTQHCSKCHRFEFHLHCNTSPRAFVQCHNHVRCVSDNRTIWLLTVLTGTLNKGEGSRSHDIEWRNGVRPINNSLFYMSHGTEVTRSPQGLNCRRLEWTRHFRSSESPSHLTAQCNSLRGDNPVLGGQRTKPEPVCPWRLRMEDQLRWPIGPNITLEQCDSYNSGRTLKTCVFRNINNIYKKKVSITGQNLRGFWA